MTEPLPTDLHAVTVSQAAGLIARRQVSPVELTEACLRRIEMVDHRLHSFVTVTAERARRDARAAETAIAASGVSGPLHGIPFGLKDIFDVQGVRTTGQSRLLADNVARADSDCMERLSAAGAILLGKNATWEFAHGGPSWDVLFPPARNPWNTERSPAGSSSGSAAAVAAGLVPFSMGTDTGGSIRSPAAACGTAGLKPTYGRVSRRGVLPNCYSHDHAGPLAWTSRDIALVLGVVAGFDARDPAAAKVAVPDYAAALTGDARGLAIGVPWGWLEEAQDATRAAFETALAAFRDLGASVRTVQLPPLADFHATIRVIAISELFSIHARNLRSRPEMFGASMRYRIIAGGLVRAEELLRAQRARGHLARAVHAVLRDVDLLMLPTSEPAGPLQEVPPERLFTAPSWTAPFSVSGNPALSVCSGFAADGMPFSMQIVGRAFDEATVLRAGDAYERATGWRARRPALAA